MELWMIVVIVVIVAVLLAGIALFLYNRKQRARKAADRTPYAYMQRRSRPSYTNPQQRITGRSTASNRPVTSPRPSSTSKSSSPAHRRSDESRSTGVDAGTAYGYLGYPGGASGSDYDRSGSDYSPPSVTSTGDYSGGSSVTSTGDYSGGSDGGGGGGGGE